MASETSSPTYTRIAKALHWLIALLVLALIGLGLYMTRAKLPLQQKFDFYQLHKSLGFTVLALMVLRVLWRLTHRPPALPETISGAERTAARLAHFALYSLLLALPVTGWLLVSASLIPVPTRLYGWLPVPHYEPLASLAPPQRKPYAELWKAWHWYLALAVIVLVVVHVLAALRHHFWLKDDILMRMLPRRRRPLPSLLASLALGTLLLSAPVVAQEAPKWMVDAAKSKVTFEARAAGQGYPGSFEKTAIDIAFDPAFPERTRIKVTIALASAKTGTDDIDSELTGKSWFDAKQFPEAVYSADKATRAAEGSYRLIGTLSLKGKSLPVELPVTLALDGKRAIAKGETVIDRLAFGVGPEGPVAGTVVDKAVKVTIEVHAERGGS